MIRPDLKLGDTIWIFDQNHRVYPKGERASGPPIYREHWRPHRIVSETSRSWEVGQIYRHWNETEDRVSTRLTKVPKSFSKYPHGICFTETQLEDACWLDRNRYRLVRHIEMIADPSLLRKVADMVGFVP